MYESILHNTSYENEMNLSCIIATRIRQKGRYPRLSLSHRLHPVGTGIPGVAGQPVQAIARHGRPLHITHIPHHRVAPGAKSAEIEELEER